MKRIIITGGNGFIASLVKESLKNTMDVVAMTRKDADFADRMRSEPGLKSRNSIMYSIPQQWHRQRIVRTILNSPIG